MKIIIDPEYKKTLSEEYLKVLEDLETVDIDSVISEEENDEEDILRLESD